MLRLDEITAQKLRQLVEQVRSSRTEIIRQLVAQAKPEDFPES
jgi:predicted transcriptional regulator